MTARAAQSLIVGTCISLALTAAEAAFPQTKWLVYPGFPGWFVGTLMNGVHGGTLALHLAVSAVTNAVVYALIVFAFYPRFTHRADTAGA